MGNLREKTFEERIEVFRTKSKKQILVAIREATSGRGFDEIIRDEFEKVQPPEAQLLYVVAALASDEEYGLTIQQMITALELPPNETQALVKIALPEFSSSRSSTPASTLFDIRRSRTSSLSRYRGQCWRTPSSLS